MTHLMKFSNHLFYELILVPLMLPFALCGLIIATLLLAILDTWKKTSKI